MQRILAYPINTVSTMFGHPSSRSPDHIDGNKYIISVDLDGESLEIEEGTSIVDIGEKFGINIDYGKEEFLKNNDIAVLYSYLMEKYGNKVSLLKIQGDGQKESLNHSVNVARKLPDYSHWNSFSNIKRYQYQESAGETENGLLIMKTEAPYTNGIDFMTLPKLPLCNLEINGRRYDESTSILTLFEETGQLDIFASWNDDESPIRRKNKNLKKIDRKGVLAEYIYEIYCFFVDKDFSVKLFIETAEGEKEISPLFPVGELGKSGRVDLSEKEKKDLQKLASSFFENVDDDDEAIFGFNYVQIKEFLDKNGNPKRHGTQDQQSLKYHHGRFFVKKSGEDKRMLLTSEQELAFGDPYLMKALSHHNFSWEKKSFHCIELLRNTSELEEHEQGIVFNVPDQELNSYFWADFDKVIEVFSNFDVSGVDLLKIHRELKKNSGNVTNYGDEILSILERDNETIVGQNKKLFTEVIKGFLDLEKDVGYYSRNSKKGVVPFPKIGFTIAVYNRNGKTFLKILPRIHTRGAIVEATGAVLDRVAVSDEEFLEGYKAREAETSKLFKSLSIKKYG